MNKKERFVDSTSTVIQGLLLVALGVLLILGRDSFVDVIAYAISLLLIIIGIVNSIKNIVSKTDKIITLNFIYLVANIVSGAFIYFNTRLFVSLFPFLFTIYIFIDAVIKMVVFIIYLKNDISGRFSVLFRSIVSYIFFAIMMFYPLIRENVTYILAGIYFILLATSYILSGI